MKRPILGGEGRRLVDRVIERFHIRWNIGVLCVNFNWFLLRFPFCLRPPFDALVLLYPRHLDIYFENKVEGRATRPQGGQVWRRPAERLKGDLRVDKECSK